MSISIVAFCPATVALCHVEHHQEVLPMGHSPGPWKYKPAASGNGEGMVYDAAGEEVTIGHCGCCFPGDEHVSAENGALIAAAPRMLELLRAVVENGEAVDGWHVVRFSPEVMEHLGALLDELKKAGV